MCMWNLCAERVPSEHGTDGRSGRRERGAAMCKSQAKCRMGAALPTAHPQHPPRHAGLNVRRAEGKCVNGLLCFIPAVEQSCWTQDSQAAGHFY